MKKTLGVAGFVYLLGVAIYQYGVWALAVFAGLAIALSVAEKMARRPKPSWAADIAAVTAALFAVYLWLQWVGSRHWLLDVSCLVLGGLLTLQAFRLRRVRVASGSLAPFLGATLLAGWLAISAVEFVRSITAEPLPLSPDRFASAERKWPALRVGIALSGGGYRAAIFHAGVLDELEDMGIQVDAVSTVSGGSIIGTFYVLGGAPRDFVDAVVDGRFNLKRRISVLPTSARLMCPGRLPLVDIELLPFCQFDRLQAQAKVLDEILLRGADFPGANRTQPQLLINMTDLQKGAGIGIARDLILIAQPQDVDLMRRPQRMKLDDELRLADLAFTPDEVRRLVLVSARKFQFVMNPAEVRNLAAWTRGRGYDLDIPTLVAKQREVFYLADGGVFENRGVRQLMDVALSVHDPADPGRGDAPRFNGMDVGERFAALGMTAGPEWAMDLVLASDASKIRESIDALTGLSAVMRAVDVASSLSDDAWVHTQRYARIKLVDLTPGDRVRDLQRRERPNSFGLQIPLSRASQEIWQYVADKPRLKQLAEILPAAAEAAMLVTALEQQAFYHRPKQESIEDVRAYFDRVPAEALEPSLVPYPRPPIEKIPPWDHSLEELNEWLAAGRCSNEHWQALFGDTAGNCEAARLAAAIALDIEHCTKVFRSASTLVDEYTAADAEAIYRLGRYVVAFDSLTINSNLQEVCDANVTCRRAHPRQPPPPVR